MSKEETLEKEGQLDLQASALDELHSQLRESHETIARLSEQKSQLESQLEANACPQAACWQERAEALQEELAGCRAELAETRQRRALAAGGGVATSVEDA